MTYLRFDGTTAEIQGDWEAITPYADKPGAVGIAKEVLPDTEEIKEETYYEELTKIKEHNAAIPQPAPPAKPEPPLTNAELKAIRTLLGKV